MAQIFNTRHGLEVKDEAESAALAAQMAQAFEAAGMAEEAEEDAREERVFRCVADGGDGSLVTGPGLWLLCNRRKGQSISAPPTHVSRLTASLLSSPQHVDELAEPLRGRADHQPPAG